MENSSLYQALQYKMDRAEKRLANAEYNVWLYKSALEMAKSRSVKVPTKKKFIQLEMFSA